MIARLALLSLRNRAGTALLTVAAIAVSVALFLVVEKVRTGARDSFADTISGTDLIVGAPSGSIQLLLYSVFRIGNATNNVSWQSYNEIAARDEVAWAVPLSLGDSHRGFRVLGTTPEYFVHYRFRKDRELEFADGGPFNDLFDAVIGADVAKALEYEVGDPIVVAHGLGSISFSEHDDKPFRVAGVLAKTGTPVDRTVHVSLEAIEAIHVDWQTGRRVRGVGVSPEVVREMNLQPKAITAALIGMKSKIATFRLQRWINEYPDESLLAVLPGVALHELWELIGTAESALTVVSAMVVVTALLGMVTMTLSSLNERRREMAILRSVGARPVTIAGLLMAEAGMLAGAGAALGVALLYVGLAAMRSYIDAQYGLYIEIAGLAAREWLILGSIIVTAFVVGGIPALRAYRMSLADGMSVRS
ncbi:MAG: ABC transporter permease [Alphaproteobacteria bacterium]|nr:ABC transporter permease [Alphaproteobacteria bacterium]